MLVEVQVVARGISELKRRHNTHVRWGWFGDDGRNLAAPSGEEFLECRQVVVGQDHGVLSGTGGHAGRVRKAQGGNARAGLNQ